MLPENPFSVDFIFSKCLESEPESWTLLRKPGE
uniref:Uncharacterized protein n=1 Tax=Rhizophora mucronata TaxID=61149 RepID=A0A2P2NWN0_RHIMU